MFARTELDLRLELSNWLRMFITLWPIDTRYLVEWHLSGAMELRGLRETWVGFLKSHENCNNKRNALNALNGLMLQRIAYQLTWWRLIGSLHNKIRWILSPHLSHLDRHTKPQSSQVCDVWRIRREWNGEAIDVFGILEEISKTWGIQNLQRIKADVFFHAVIVWIRKERGTKGSKILPIS